jgi:hypothetical protein
MKEYNKDSWFLIDFSDAATTPTRPTNFVQENHSPRVREPNHGAEVDIWGVGHCLKQLAARNRVQDAPAVVGVGGQWMDDVNLTADGALAQIKVWDPEVSIFILILFP